MCGKIKQGCYIITFLHLLLSFNSLNAETTTGGVINSDTRWSVSSSPYIVTTDLTIYSDVTLTIEPGVIILFGYNTSMYIKGNLSAIGTNELPIVFSANLKNPNNPFWGCIGIMNSIDNKAEFENCRIEYAGKNNKGAVLIYSSSKYSFKNTSLKNNKVNAIELAPGKYDGTTVLNYFGLPYVIQSTIDIQTNSKLIIKPGTILKFGNSAKILCRGNISAEGLKDAKIIFTSINDDYCDNNDVNNDGMSVQPKPGDWCGVFLIASTMVNSKFDFVVFRYGGSNYLGNNSLFGVEAGSPVIEGCTFSNSAGSAIRITGTGNPDFGGGVRNSAGYNSFIGFSRNNPAVINQTSRNISAKNNCWATQDTLEVMKLISDGRTDAAFGIIQFFPVKTNCSVPVPDSPILTYPQNGLGGLELEFSAHWNKVFGATTYRFTVALSQDMKINFLDKEGISDTIFKISGLSSNTDYYAQISAQNSNGSSPLSAMYYFRTIDTNRPDVPVLVYPDDLLQNVDCDVGFEWSRSLTAQKYRLQVSVDSLFSELEFDSDEITNLNRIVEGFDNNLMYYWRVAAWNVNGWSNWSQPRSFVTEKIFTPFQTNIQPLSNGKAVWADFNGDLKLDLIISGIAENGIPISKIYKNDITSFTEILSNIAGAAYPCIAVTDIDGNGTVDLFIAGFNANGNWFAKIYKNQDEHFTEIQTDIEPVEYPAAAFADFDGNGSPDLVISGKNVSGKPVTNIYYNYNGNFTNGFVTLPGASNAALAVSDADNDGYNDLIISGIGLQSETFARLLVNNSEDFKDAGITFNGVANGTIAAFDFFGSGKSDIFISGKNPESMDRTEIYLNDSSKFRNILVGLPSLQNPNIAVGDYDSDGYSDIFFTGELYALPKTQVFRNSNGGFYEVQLDLENLKNSAAQFADYNMDGTLDLFIMGEDENGKLISKLYQNNLKRKNTPPSTPTDLSSNYKDGNLTLSWNQSSDTETPIKSISYNVRVGLSPGGNEVLSGLADANTGIRKTPGYGNTGMKKSITLNSIQSGKYYWSVQAIDNSYASSTFAQQELFLTPDLAQSLPSSWSHEYLTGENSTILIRSNVEQNFGQHLLNAGDGIGIFYPDGNNLKCAGYSVWDGNKNIAITVWGDNKQTVDKDGFSFYEPYRFKIWNSGKQTEYPVTVQWESGSTNFVPDILSIVKSIDLLDSMSLPIQKNEWRMLSAHISHYYGQIDSILNNKPDILRNKSGKLFWSNKNIVDFENWNYSEGYYAYALNTDSIIVRGNKIDIDKFKLPLTKKQWYIVPYLPSIAQTPEEALSSIENNLLLAANSKGEIYLPTLGFNTIDSIKSGEGLKLILSSDDTLQYNAYIESDTHKIDKHNYIFYKNGINPSCFSSFLILNCQNLLDGDEIAVFMPQLKLAGKGFAKKGKAFITVFGTTIFGDKTVMNIDESKPFTVKYWSKLEKREYNLNIASIRDYVSDTAVALPLTFNNDRIFNVKAIKGKISSVESDDDLNFAISAEPNPFSDLTKITISTNKANNIVVNLYNYLGAKVENLINEKIEAGSFTINLHKNDLPVGIYYLSARCGNDYSSIKLFIY
ncbi:MAG: regulatory domain of subtilisin-like proprotein convertase [Ignavibacteria bacterium]|nr:regulatory domain of subtilisin-like proprotein convertase [Ignavibacteria bacterium]